MLLLTADQLPYARSIAYLTPLRRPTAADRAADRAEELRAKIAGRLAAGDVDAELALLAPLFERHEPAEVAAALLALSGAPAAIGPPLSAVSDQPDRPAAQGSWTKIFVTVGKKDRAGAKDIVGALTREVGVARDVIGRIEVKETFCVLEIAPAAVEQVVRGLTGVTIRGRRVIARRDREV